MKYNFQFAWSPPHKSRHIRDFSAEVLDHRSANIGTRPPILANQVEPLDKNCLSRIIKFISLSPSHVPLLLLLRQTWTIDQIARFGLRSVPCARVIPPGNRLVARPSSELDAGSTSGRALGPLAPVLPLSDRIYK